MTHFLERLSYERCIGKDNIRNGSYSRKYALKGIGNVEVKIPREFQTQVIPRSNQYEEELARDMGMTFLAGMGGRSLSMLSRRLLGRSISATEIGNVNTQLTESVEKWKRRDLILPQKCGHRVKPLS